MAEGRYCARSVRSFDRFSEDFINIIITNHKAMKNKLFKLFFPLSVFILVISISSAAPSDLPLGSLIKSDQNSSVYYYDFDGKRDVFPDEQTYFSWYKDFFDIHTISSEDLSTIPLGSNITIRPGTKLVKIKTDPKVYAVDMNCFLVHIPDEEIAVSLYGNNWAKKVVDVLDSFFMNYSFSNETLSFLTFPRSSLIQMPGSEDIYYIDID